MIWNGSSATATSCCKPLTTTSTLGSRACATTPGLGRRASDRSLGQRAVPFAPMAGPGDLDPVLLRERLAVNRRRGVPFDEAWRRATVGLSAKQSRTFPQNGTMLSQRGLAE